MYVIVKNNFVILFLGLDRIPFPSTHSQCFLLLLLFFVLLLVLRRRYAYCSIFEGSGGCPFRAFLYVLPFVVLLLFLVVLPSGIMTSSWEWGSSFSCYSLAVDVCIVRCSLFVLRLGVTSRLCSVMWRFLDSFSTILH